MRVATPVLFALTLAACGGGAPETRTYTLPKGGETVIAFPADEPMMVSFGFELGSRSWNETDNCPLAPDASDFAREHGLGTCGALFDANADGDAFQTYFKGLHGGGVTFQPRDGEIRVRLKNLAHTEMDFQVEVKPAEG